MEDLSRELKALKNLLNNSDLGDDVKSDALLLLTVIDSEVKSANLNICKKIKDGIQKGGTNNKYKELKNKYDKVVEDNKKLLSVVNGITELRSKEDKILKHADKVKNGNISFKSDIDMNLVIKLYTDGYGAGGIAKKISISGVKVSRQTIVNRLKRIGLWGSRDNWNIHNITKEQEEYINKHNIEI